MKNLYLFILLIIVLFTFIFGFKIFNKYNKKIIKYKVTINTIKRTTTANKNQNNKVNQCNFIIKVKPNNYTLDILIKPTGHCDHGLLVKVYKSIPATTNLLTETQLIGHSYISATDYEKPSGAIVNFSWPLIGSFIGRITVTIYDLTENQTIYTKTIYIYPKYIFLNKTYRIKNTNLLVEAKPKSLRFNGVVEVNISNGVSMISHPFPCINTASLLCPGYIEIVISNIGNSNYFVNIPNDYIVAINRTLSKFPSKMDGLNDLHYIVKTSSKIPPNGTVNYYMVIYMSINSKPYLVYFRIIVNGKPYEFNLVFTKKIKNLVNSIYGYPFTS